MPSWSLGGGAHVGRAFTNALLVIGRRAHPRIRVQAGVCPPYKRTIPPMLSGTLGGGHVRESGCRQVCAHHTKEQFNLPLLAIRRWASREGIHDALLVVRRWAPVGAHLQKNNSADTLRVDWRHAGREGFYQCPPGRLQRAHVGRAFTNALLVIGRWAQVCAHPTRKQFCGHPLGHMAVGTPENPGAGKYVPTLQETDKYDYNQIRKASK